MEQIHDIVHVRSDCYNKILSMKGKLASMVLCMNHVLVNERRRPLPL